MKYVLVNFLIFTVVNIAFVYFEYGFMRRHGWLSHAVSVKYYEAVWC